MISFSHVSKQFPQSDRPAVDNVSFIVQQGEIFVLLGSSGSGKTTLMKMINRLVEPDSGVVSLKGTPVQQYKLNPLRHNIGYVFQQAGLFPHMSVAENIAVVLRLQGQSKIMRQHRAHELLEMMHLDPQQYANRYLDELSGGEQQRIGVARALAADPDYLLMDEPFAALDAINRVALQREILELNQRLDKTIVFVTHDLNEAFNLADRIGILHEGKIAQIGTRQQLVDNPATAFVENLLRANE